MKNTRGFTLAELLVSVGIMMLLTAIVLLNFRTAGEPLILERAAEKLTQDIKRAAALSAQAGQDVYCGGSISGYGLYVEEDVQTSYIIFANCNGAAKPGYKSSQDVIVQTIPIESGSQLPAVDPLHGTSTGGGRQTFSQFAITFFPPDPTVFLCVNDNCSGPNSLSEAEIILELSESPSETRTIIVNGGGFIDTNN